MGFKGVGGNPCNSSTEVPLECLGASGGVGVGLHRRSRLHVAVVLCHCHISFLNAGVKDSHRAVVAACGQRGELRDVGVSDINCAPE